MRVIFVCTGNTCRSPMAEYLFRSMISEAEKDEIKVDSAGIMASSGSPASENTVKILTEAGIDGIKNHHSKPVAEIFPESDDLFLGMTQSHKQHLLNQFAGREVDVFTLNEYIDSELNLSDPYGHDLSQYRKLFQQLKPALQTLKQKIIRG